MPVTAVWRFEPETQRFPAHFLLRGVMLLEWKQ